MYLMNNACNKFASFVLGLSRNTTIKGINISEKLHSNSKFSTKQALDFTSPHPEKKKSSHCIHVNT